MFILTIPKSDFIDQLSLILMELEQALFVVHIYCCFTEPAW